MYKESNQKQATKVSVPDEDTPTEKLTMSSFLKRNPPHGISSSSSQLKKKLNAPSTSPNKKKKGYDIKKSRNDLTSSPSSTYFSSPISNGQDSPARRRSTRQIQKNLEKSLQNEISSTSSPSKRIANDNRTTATATALRAPTSNTASQQISAPQVRIVDGKIMIDEESLTVLRQKQQQKGGGLLGEKYQNLYDDGEDIAGLERVEETNRKVTSASFKKTAPRERWTDEDTKLFYEALSVWGTDFGLISQALPNRTREQVKNKFKKEEKMNPHMIKEYLNRRNSYNPKLFGKLKTSSSSA